MAAGAAWLGGSRGGSPTIAPPVQGNAVAVVDAHSARLVGSIPVGADPGPIVARPGFLWVSNLGDGSISRIATDSRSVAGLTHLGMPASGLAASGNAIYAVANGPIDPYVTVERIDPAFDTAKRVARVATVIGGDAALLVAERSGRLLVTPSSGLMTWIDPRTGRATVLADPSATSVAAAQGFGSSWLVEADGDAVVRVEANGTQTTIPVGRGPSAIAIGAGRVWIADRLDDQVKRIDPATNSIDGVVPVAGAPSGLAFSGTTLWVTSSRTGTLTRIDATTGRVIAPAVRIGGSPQSLVVADGKVWVTVQRRELPATATAGGTVVVNRPSPNEPMILDPALAYLPNAQLILYSTCLQLLNYPDKPGRAGIRLVPDAARTLPTLSRDRRTLTFVIRTGNALLAAVESGRHGGHVQELDRAQPGPPPRLQGRGSAGTRVPHGRRRHARILGRQGSPRHGHHGARKYPHDPAAAPKATVAGAPLDGALLRSADERPAHAADLWPDPVRRALFHLVELTEPGARAQRNPNYHGSRPHAPRKIVIRFGMSGEQSVAQIASGRADYGLLGVPWSDGTACSDVTAEAAARPAQVASAIS